MIDTMENPEKKFKHVGNVQKTTYPDRIYTFNEVFEHILKENRKDVKEYFVKKVTN